MFKSLFNHPVATDQLYFSKCIYNPRLVPQYYQFHRYLNNRVHTQKDFIFANSIGTNATRHRSTKSCGSRASNSSPQKPAVSTLLLLSTEAIVKSIQQISDSKQPVSLEFIKDLIVFVHSKAESFTLENLLLVLLWLSAQQQISTEESSDLLFKVVVPRVFDPSLTGLSNGDLANAILLISNIKLKLRNANCNVLSRITPLLTQIDCEVCERIVSSHATQNLIHAVLTASINFVDVMSLAEWKCLPLAVSVVEQQKAAAFSASQLRDLALLTIGQKGLLRPSSIGKNRDDDCVLFDELSLAEQISILVTCEGKVKAKALCERCLCGLQREIDDHRHVDKIVLLKLTSLARLWKPATRSLQGALPHLIRSKLHEYSTTQVLQIIQNFSAVKFYPTSLGMKVEMILKQRAKSTPDLLILTDESYIQMLKDVSSFQIKNRALFKFFAEGLLVPQLDSICEDDLLEIKLRESSPPSPSLLFSNSLKSSRLASFDINNLLLIFHIWSSVMLVDNDLFNSVSQLLVGSTDAPRPASLFRAIIACSSLFYRNTNLFSFFENHLQSIDFNDDRYQIFELIRLKQAMDSLGMHDKGLEERLNKAVPSTEKEKQMEQFSSWLLGAHRYHPNLHTHGAVRSRKSTW